MCGFVGIWNFINNTVDADHLRMARDLMISRGPDQDGIWLNSDHTLGFAHRRLSIQDTSLNGKQPITSNIGNVLVFNGEIYNFKELKTELEGMGATFSSNTDSEVILAAYNAWGEACVCHFIGMFAFALYEPAQSRLFLARDRFGVKPLFYKNSPESFLFSSRLAPIMLLENNSIVNISAVAQLLEMGWITGNQTLIEGVYKLLPGHTAYIDHAGITTSKYWDSETATESNIGNNNFEHICNSFEELIHESVKDRMISDVPVGVFLSGGIDSSLVTAMMCRESTRPVRAYTIGYTSAQFDESRHAKAIANYLECEYNEYIVTGDSILSEVNDVLESSDEPLTDIASLPTSLLAKYASEEVKVCLTGDGGDELFLGYPLHRVLDEYNWVHKLPLFFRRYAALICYKLPSKKLKLFSGLLSNQSLAAQYLFLRSISGKPLSNEWVAQSYLQKATAHSLSKSVAALSAQMDIKTYLADGLLPKTDLSTMRWSLEAREPLLDYRLAEKANAIPKKHMMGKKILKNILSKHVPEHLWNRPKHAFDVPIDDWLRNQLKDKLYFLQNNWSFHEVLSGSQVSEMVNNHIDCSADNGDMLWSMVALTYWFERHRKWLSIS